LFGKKAIIAAIDYGEGLAAWNVISHVGSAAICRQPHAVFLKHFTTGRTALTTIKPWVIYQFLSVGIIIKCKARSEFCTATADSRAKQSTSQTL
jgi:hypothetical protein